MSVSWWLPRTGKQTGVSVHGDDQIYPSRAGLPFVSCISVTTTSGQIVSNLGPSAHSVAAWKGDRLQPRDFIVIGGSAGSIKVVKTIVANLPPDFPGSVFVVVHVSADSPGLLAELLSNSGPLPASNPFDQEQIQRRHIYVSRPDHHLTIEDGRVRVLRGPRENRHRPAIDPLFRSAAREYGPRVVGIILSGLQDDGCAGLYAVKQRGGIAIVQDPRDADWKDMPSRAIEYADPHYILAVRDIAPLVAEFANGQESELVMANKNTVSRRSNGRNEKRPTVSSAATGNPDANENAAYSEEGEGKPSVFACPECHGVLWELKDREIVRFRCRVGHSYGTESLSRELSMASEAALWAAVRALEEKAALQRRIAEGVRFDRTMSSRLLDQCAADVSNARMIRDMIFRRDAQLEPEAYRSKKKPEPEKKKIA